MHYACREAAGLGGEVRQGAPLLVSIALFSLLPAVGASRADATPPPAIAMPARPPESPSGTQFAKRTDGWPDAERQRAAVEEIERGNLPQFSRRFLPIELRYEPAGHEAISATIWVMPDYLAIGGDDDFLYAPLNWPSATEIARRFGCVVPTRRMVDAIYAQAAHLAPQPMPAGPQMRSNAYFERHQALIDAQRAAIPLGTLISGHKKDVVLSERLFGRPDRIAIYGWHRLDGRPIQPLSTVHGVRYADYSHGVRLVWGEVSIDGARRSITDVLSDRELAPVLSDEGAIRDPRALLDPARAAAAAASTAVAVPPLAAN